MKLKNGKALGAAFMAAFLVLGALAWLFGRWSKSYLHDDQNLEVQLLEQLETHGLGTLEGKKLDGSSFSSKDLKESSILVVNFWASWCGPCIEEVPSLIQLVQKNSRIQVIAISQDSSLEDIQAFLKSFPGFKNSQIHILWDEDRKLMGRFRSERLPESFVFNSKGKLVKKVVGSIDWASPSALEFLGAIH